MEDSDEQECFLERGYQTILAEQAYESNKILFLPTGSGKTFIAIMVLKRLFPLLEPPFSVGGKRAVFLVNTVALVEQQAEVLLRHLCVSEVGQYSGDMHVDFWNKCMWDGEFEKFQVMVMTADILKDLLLKKYISLSDLALLILDECHHAVSDHPMRQIMKLFEDCPKSQQPRVIGLTATLLNGTPKSIGRLQCAVKELEITLHSTVATVDSWDIVKQFSTKPREKFIIFPNYCGTRQTDFIHDKITQMYNLCQNFKFVTEDNLLNHLQIEHGFVPMMSGKKNEVANLLLQVSKQLEWLGPFGCFRTIQAIFVSLRIMQEKMSHKSCHLMIHSLYCDLFALSRRLLKIMDVNGHSEEGKSYHFSSPKVQSLVDLLETANNACNSQPEHKREPLQALIFVQEKMTAKVLSSVLKNIAKESKRYAFIQAAFVVGGSSNPFSETWEGAYSKHTNDRIINRFREKITNVLVCTDVLEEGIDIPDCNLVVRFDLACGVRSYIQSKGRARHDTSLFALMVPASDSGNYSQKIHHFRTLQKELEMFLVGHTADRMSPSEFELDNLYESTLEPYYTPLGSKVTETSSIQLVNGYCMFLAHDRFCKVLPVWQYRKVGAGQVIVGIKLPRLSPLQELVRGQAMANIRIAKRAAALEMCIRLHKIGELNDYLLPNEKVLAEEDLKIMLPLWEEEDPASEVKPGTSKRIRSYPLHKPICYQDCAPGPGFVYLHYIEINPVYKPIIGRKTMIYNVYNEKRNFAIVSSWPLNNVCQFPVFSKFGEIKVRIAASSKTISICEEEFNKISLYHWNLFSSIIPMVKSYLVYSKDSYLIAPTKLDGKGEIVLDWNSMEAANHPDRCSSSDLLKSVIVPTHRGLSSPREAYFVTRICTELNGSSPFPDTAYSSYSHYFKAKHKFTISNPELPLLEVQPINIISNDLIPRSKKSKTEDESVTYFPMECCKILSTDGCLVLKASLLPSILHRLERFLIAANLCDKIVHEMGGKRGTLSPYPGKSLGTNCSFWEGLTGFIENAEDSDVSRPKPVVSFVKDTDSPPHKKKKSSSGKPWHHLQEPKDVEHNFEHVTIDDIDTYAKFVRTKISFTPASRFSNKNDVLRKIPPLRDGEGTIKCLTNSSDIPHPCHILEAMTAASADDIWNLERLETLGDSFLKFAVSYVLFSRFPDLPEGKLTQLKGQILGNRNLFYCAKAKQLASYLKVKKVVPSEGWIPPSFSIPEKIIQENLTSLVRRLDLSKEEQFNGLVKLSSIESLRQKSIIQQTPLPLVDLNQHEIPDKSVADCVESLIGAHLQVCGPYKAIEFLEYMMVVPKGSKELLSPTSPTKSKGQPGQPSHLLNLKVLQDVLGYKFKDMSLLVEALTHASFPSATRTYERLEFVGDAVIDFLVTAYIFENCGKLSPGELTDLRSALVNNITFACLSVRYGFYKFMNHGSPALMDSMDRFLKYQIERDHIIDEEVLIMLEETECRIAETVEVPKALGDVFEALIGAVFIDSGKKFALVWQVIYRLIKTEIRTFSQKVPKQVVRRLYETVGQHNISFRNSESPPEMRLEQVHVVLTVTIGCEKQSFNGFGSNKNQAKKSAAKLALRHVQAE